MFSKNLLNSPKTSTIYPLKIPESENDTYSSSDIEKAEPAGSENTDSSYQPSEQMSEPFIADIPEIPVVPYDEVIEIQPEQSTAWHEEHVSTEETPEQSESSITTDAPSKENPESISLISFERSRTDVFDAIHAASPQTETVSAHSDFELELTADEFSAIVDYLNSNEIEFVISKSPETDIVSTSFIFKEDKEEIPPQQELEPAQEQHHHESSDNLIDETEIPHENTDQINNITE